MPKVSVTIKNGVNQRNYDGDYVYVAVLNDESGDAPPMTLVQQRWIQEPSNWSDGIGLFFSALMALRSVAEQSGNEAYKVAARAAMDAMSVYDPERQDEGYIEKDSGDVEGVREDFCEEGEDEDQ